MRCDSKTVTFLLILFVSSVSIYPCTSFSLNKKNKHCFGKNYDFPIGNGHVSVNKRNCVKVSIPMGTEKKVAWVSKYGSITFNQFGKELPCGGMNETGLVIELMALPNTTFPAPDFRFGLTELQWIQYMLDNFASVEEVLASDNSIRMSNNSMVPIHVLISDKMGNSATLEYLNNKTEIHQKGRLPVPVLTNNTYHESFRYFMPYIHKWNPDYLPQTASSLDRFVRAAWYVSKYRPGRHDALDYSFSILQSVNADFTQWSIVYDMENLTIHYKTFNNGTVRSITMSDFDFSPATPSLYIDIDSDVENGISDFLTYSHAANSQLIETVFSSLDGFRDVPPEVRAELANYPETIVPLLID